jgi:hypothetical protein
VKVGDAGLGVLDPAQVRCPLDDPARDRVAEQDDLRVFQQRLSAIEVPSELVSLQYLEPWIDVRQPSQIRPQIRRDHDHTSCLRHRSILPSREHGPGDPAEIQGFVGGLAYGTELCPQMMPASWHLPAWTG